MSIENLKTQFDEHATAVVALANDVRASAANIDLIKAEIDKLSEKQAALFLNGTGGGGQNKRKAKSKLYHALGAFGRAGGNAGLGEFPDVRAAMTVQSDPDGGYTVVPEVDTSIHAIARDVSPMFDLANVKLSTRNSYKWIVDDSLLSAGWVGETEARPQTDSPKLKERTVTCGEIYANPAASQTLLLDDSDENIADWLVGKAGTAFAVNAGAAFISGDGIKSKPRGILTYPTDTSDDFTRAYGSIQYVAAGSTTPTSAQLADALVAMSMKLRVPYRPNARWLMSRDSARVCRQLKDSTLGLYLWSGDGRLVEGAPGELLGFPVRLCEDMPSIAANALSNPFDSGGALGNGKGVGLSAEFQASTYKAMVSQLGAAATLFEQQKAKVLELDAALAKHVITQETYNRAVAGIGLETVIQLESQRISILGQAATVDEIVKQKQDEITAARMRGITITAQEAAEIIAATAAQKQASDTSILAANNVVTAEQLRSAKLAELNALLLQHKLTQDGVTTSMSAYEKVIRQTVESQEQAKSQLPQLTQLTQEWGNGWKQFDTFATTSLNDVVTGLDSVAMGTAKGGDAFRTMATQVLSALDQMLLKMLIVQPIAKALQSTISGFGGFGTSGASIGTGVTQGASGGLTASALGNVFQDGRTVLHPYALGGITSDIVVKPTLFKMATGAGLMGEAGPEAIMPLRRGPDGRLGVAAGGGAGGGMSIVNQNSFSVSFGGPAPSNPQDQAAMLGQMRREFENMIGAWALKQQKSGGILPKKSI